MSARAWVMFLSVAVLWGVPYYFIKVAVEDGVPPAFVAWARVTLGAVLLGALIVAALILTPAALAAPPDTMPPIEAFASLAVLGVFCTALAFVLFMALVGEVGPGRATVITYVAPLVALTLGVAALDERPGAGAVIGLALIVAGSSLATRPPTTNVLEGGS